MVAVATGNIEVAKLLLEKGAAVEAKNRMGQTLLWIAAWNGRVEAVRLLLEKGANPNI